MNHNVFIFVMVSYVLPFLPVSMVILELVVQDQSFYARLCRVRPRRARQVVSCGRAFTVTQDFEFEL